MIQHENILTIIPARGGSKGIPRKNIRNLCGKPLIAYSIEVALSSKYIEKVIVSTEDEEIAEIAKKWGAEVPFFRPVELSTDTAKSIDVAKHSIEEIEKITDDEYPIIVFLEPPAPFRSSEDIDNCIELYLKHNSGSVVSVCEANKYHPAMMKIIKDNSLIPYSKENFTEGIPRQLLRPEVYMINGCIYISQRDNIMDGDFYGDPILPYIMPYERSINIDTLLDWHTAEAIINSQK